MVPNWRLVSRFSWISTTKVMLRGVSYLLYTYQNEIAVKYVCFLLSFFFIKCRNIFPPGDSDFVDLTLMHFIFFCPKRTYQSCKPNQYLDRSGYFLKNDTKWHTNIFHCKIFKLQSMSPLGLKKNQSSE